MILTYTPTQIIDMPDYNSKHQRWYDAYKALCLTEGLIRHITDDHPTSKEICNLLQVCQYLAQTQTVIVQGDTVDGSLVDDDAINPDELDDLFQAVLHD